MNITIYRYNIVGASWDWNVVPTGFIENLSAELSRQPFFGEAEENQFGFTQVGVYQDKIFGLFIQKYKAFIINYHPETKEEIKQEVINSGEYFFVLDLVKRIVFLQSKRQKELPDKKEVIRRFIDQLIVVLFPFHLGFTHLEETEELVDRDLIVNIFYNFSDTVLEVDLEDFDKRLIDEEKLKRGGARQTYFNPIEEYQEAMEEGAKKLALHAEKTIIRAKKGESLKKDPITRAALEAARRPVKIVYTLNDVTHTQTGVVENKKTLNIDSESYDLNDDHQLSLLMKNLYEDGTENIISKSDSKPKGKDLFNSQDI